MKILMIGSDLDRGGIGSVIMTLYRSLVKKNIKCDLTYYKGMKPNQEIINEIRNNGDNVYEILSVKQAGLSYIGQVYKLCKKNHYDAIHIHTNLLIWLAAFGAKLAGVRVRIGHAHGAKFLNYSEKVLFFLEPVGRWLNKILCTNYVTCSQMSAQYTFGNNATFIPNYVSPSEIISISNNDINKEYKKIVNGSNRYDYIFGYTGCLDGVKNAIFLLDIVKALKDIDINILLILIGRTDEYSKFNKKVKQLHIEENVKLLGYRKECKIILQNFDYYISASTTEGMSMSMIEAQMSGIPCFTSSLIPKNSDLGIDLFFQIDGFDADKWAEEIARKISIGYRKIDRKQAIGLLNQTELCEEKAINKLIDIYKGEKN